MNFKPFTTEDRRVLAESGDQINQMMKAFRDMKIFPPLRFLEIVHTTLNDLHAMVSDNIGEDLPQFTPTYEAFPSELISNTRQASDYLRRALYHMPRDKQKEWDLRCVIITRLFKHYIKVMSWMLHNKTQGV